MKGQILNVQSGFVRKASRRGGVGMEDAIEAAQTRLIAMSDRAMVQIDACVVAAGDAARRLTAGDGAALEDLRSAADTLVSLGGLFGLDGLARAASSLCTLIDWVGGAIDAKAVRVHLEAIQLFRHADAGMLAVSTAPVLEGLAQVSSHLGVPAAAAPRCDRPPSPG